MVSAQCSIERIETLVHGVAGGDRAALAELWDTASPLLLALEQRERSRDDRYRLRCVDVFLEIWRQAPTRSVGGTCALAWILDVARNAPERVRAALVGRSVVAGGDHELLTLARTGGFCYDDLAVLLHTDRAGIVRALEDALERCRPTPTPLRRPEVGRR